MKKQVKIICKNSDCKKEFIKRTYHHKYCCKECCMKEIHKKYNKSFKGIARRRKHSKTLKNIATNKKYCLNNSEKRKAKSLARKIKIPKGQICEKCNKNLATGKHHPDYSKWDKVVFCCKPCHPILDKERRQKEK